MATIKDVAKMAGVSVCTVSRAIAGKGYIGQETYDRVMKAVEELQYTPNKTAVGLKTGRTNIIALVVPGIRNVYYPKLATCVQSYADEKVYDAPVQHRLQSGKGKENDRKAVQPEGQRRDDHHMLQRERAY